jgi:hypothetical protein
MNLKVNSNTVEDLRDAGYCVVVFNPEELEGADPYKVSDFLIERGWDVIEAMKPLESL